MDNETKTNETIEDNSVKEPEITTDNKVVIPPEYEKELMDRVNAKMTEFMKKYLKEGSVVNKPVETTIKKKQVKDLKF